MDAAEIEKLADLEASHWWYAARRSMLRRAVSGLTPGDALDVGAGAGGNTTVLAEAGWRARAVELSESGSGIAHGRGLPVARADATSLPFPDAAFDLVVAMDLWEHIDDDASAAAEAFRVLRPGGHLYVAVPCDMRLWSGHDVAVGHVRRYEREELLALVTGAGFTVDDVRSWNVLLRPAVRWHRRDGRGGEGASECSSDLEPVARPLNWALRAVVEAERRLPVGNRKGVSLVVRATKPG